MDPARPPDLGQMCTVYVADAAALAVKEGYTRADIFAGFQYSVIHNYLHRVMGQRTLGERVFFQGKPASNPSLAWTLAAVTPYFVADFVESFKLTDLPDLPPDEINRLARLAVSTLAALHRVNWKSHRAAWGTKRLKGLRAGKQT